MEWQLGITDSSPRHWKQREPCWDDEQLTATSSHTFQEMVAKLCESALAKRRGNHDSGIDEHLWNLKISSIERAIQRENPMALLEDNENEDGDEEEDDSEDDSETNYRGGILVAPQQHRRQYQEEEDLYGYQFIPSSEKLSRALLPQGHVVQFTYDFGTTTELYLKVLRVRPVGVQSLLGYFEATANVQAEAQDLEAVPAHHLPKEQQIDAYYPNFSKAFLGHYVPLQKSRSDSNDNDEDYHHPASSSSVAIGSVTLGLSSRVRSEKDTTFCSMENSDCSSDLFYSSQPFADMNEFFNVSEQAWTPRSPEHDPDHLDRYRYSMVSRHVFPANDANANEAYEHLLQFSKSEQAQFGPKLLLFRLDDEEKKKRVDFDFAKLFPKTHAQFQSGKFRWIKYKNGVLRVLVGRGAGHDNRDFGRNQVLRTWKRNFSSLHELLCAVEASWVYHKKDLGVDAVIPGFDLDLGPSKPGPKEPPLLSKKEDGVVVATSNDTSKLVTTLAIAQEDDGTTVLYSGYADGTLTKWCLVQNRQIWSKQIYPDGTKEYPHVSCIGIHLQGTAGVAGLVVRKSGKHHLIYTWSDAYNGFPNKKWKSRGPSEVKCWRGRDGGYVRSYACDVGPDENGEPARPSISTVVFCRLRIEDEWVESMVVGLHCLCQTLVFDSDYSDFDIDEAQQVSEGNILPFYEHSNGIAMETWRGHTGIVKAMAVIPDQYLLSYSMRHGHGLPDAMILWSLEEPGVPLVRHDLWDPSRSLFKQNLTRLHNVDGISVSGTSVLFACESGDRVAVVTVQNDDHGAPKLKLHGYGNIGNRYHEDSSFHGNMAMSGKYAVMSNEGLQCRINNQ